jgi:hypothetical protein
MTAKGEKMVTTHLTMPERILKQLRVAHAKMVETDGHMSFAQAIRVVLLRGLRSFRK